MGSMVSAIGKVAFFLLLFLTAIMANCEGQDTLRYKVRNFVFTTPVSRNTIINGLAVGLAPLPMKDAERLKINGLNLYVNPLTGAYFIAAGIFGTLAAPFAKDSLDGQPSDPLVSNKTFVDSSGDYRTQIRGVSIGAGALPAGTLVKGLSIELVASLAEKTEGIGVSGLVNLQYDFDGVLIAGLRNKTTKGNGLQVALFNSCKEGKVFQLGLINRIGKRTLPFINFKLK